MGQDGRKIKTVITDAVVSCELGGESYLVEDVIFWILHHKNNAQRKRWRRLRVTVSMVAESETVR